MVGSQEYSNTRHGQRLDTASRHKETVTLPWIDRAHKPSTRHRHIFQRKQSVRYHGATVLWEKNRRGPLTENAQICGIGRYMQRQRLENLVFSVLDRLLRDCVCPKNLPLYLYIRNLISETGIRKQVHRIVLPGKRICSQLLMYQSEFILCFTKLSFKLVELWISSTLSLL